MLCSFHRSPPIVELNLLDCVLPDIPSTLVAHEQKLIKLPEEFTKLNPLLSKLQIMNLIPLDGEKSYNKNDVVKLNNFMRKNPKDAKFSAKIDTIIGDVMFAKNIVATKDNKTAVIFRLTDAHSKLGISGRDDRISEKIMSLSKALKTEDPVDDKNEAKELTKEDQNQGTMTEKSTSKPVEPLKYWKHLKHDTSYQIIVKEYISPYSFFAILINHENLTLKNNLKAIEESQDNKQLISININECCLFNSDNRYLRAVILNILADGQMEVLLVDYGEIQKCDEKSLFEIPKEFLNLNFQAIHCSMLGICPKFGMKFWPTLQKSAVHKLISEYNEKPLKMFVVKDDQKKHQFRGTGVSSYDVQLYDDESKSYLSKLAIKQGIASECVEYNDDFYESPVDDADFDSLMDTSSCCSGLSNDEELYMSRMLELMKMSESESVLDEISDYASGTDSAELMSSNLVESTKTMSIDSADSTESMSTELTKTVSNDSTVEVPSSALKSLLKMPHIEWRQNNFMIYLLITANDCTEYALSINETSLDVVIKYQEDNKIERSVIQLYGSIKPMFCSHELAGINIIVRLAKKYCGLNWPRLTMSHEKSIYIKFSNDVMPYWHSDIDHYGSYELKPDFSDNEDVDKESNDLESNISSDDEF